MAETTRVISNLNDTLPAAPAGSDNVKWQINRGVTPPNISANVPRADVAGTKYGTIIYDGSDSPTRYLGADGEWHDVASGNTACDILVVGARADYDEIFVSEDLEVHQGYCTDGEYHYVVDTAAIYKLAYGDLSVIASNVDPFNGLARGYTHLGAPICHGGYIYIPTEEYPHACPHGDRAILVFSASDLSLADEIYGTDTDNNGGMVALALDPETNLVYSPDSCEDTKVRVYSFPDFEYQSTLTVDRSTTGVGGVGVQGATWHDGKLYLSWNDGYVREVNTTTGVTTLAFTSPHAGGSYLHEGIDWTQHDLRWLIDHDTPGHGYLHIFSNANLLSDSLGLFAYEPTQDKLVKSLISYQINGAAPFVPTNINFKAGANITLSQDALGVTIAASGGTGSGYTKPDIDGWTWTDQGSAVAYDLVNSVRVRVNNSSTWRFYHGVCPATPYAIDCLLRMRENRSSGSSHAGMGLRYSTDGKRISFKIKYNGALTVEVEQIGVGVVTETENLIPTLMAKWISGYPIFCRLKITDDGTTRKYYYNADPEYNAGVFTLLHSENHSEYIVPDQLGFSFYNSGSNYLVVEFIDWQQT